MLIVVSNVPINNFPVYRKEKYVYRRAPIGVLFRNIYCKMFCERQSYKQQIAALRGQAYRLVPDYLPAPRGITFIYYSPRPA